MNTTTMTPSELQQALTEMTAERDALQEQVDDWGEPETLAEELQEMEAERDELLQERDGLLQSPPAAHKAQYYNTHMLIKRCGYGHGHLSIFEYTAYGWGSCDRTADGSWQVDCPDKAFVWPDYEDTKILAMMN